MKNRTLQRRGLRLGFAGSFLVIALLGATPRTFSFSSITDLARAAIPLGLPLDLWDYYIPRDNKQTAQKIELGRKLFFDKRLSADSSIACATCHDPKLGFTDGKAVAEGVGLRHGTRNSPTLLNVLFNPGQFWDGRSDSLEDQAVLPLTNPLEMGNPSLEIVITRLRALPEYVVGFRDAFGDEVTAEGLARAIASYERTLIAGDSAFDRYHAGDQTAIGESPKRGFALFRGKARCSRCHTFSEQMPLFSDFAYHNTGVAAQHPNFENLSRKAYEVAGTPERERFIDQLKTEVGGDELGRMSFSYQIFDLGSFRTPSLRNVALTAPYFHNGSARTLADVVRFYNEGGKPNLNREWDLNALALSEVEQRDLVAFLESLTGRLP